jgi:ubiquinone biosynthesis protein UbiJ
VRDAGARARRTGRNVLDSVAEYWLDENPQVVRRTALGGFDAELARARDALARVENGSSDSNKIGARAGSSLRGAH